MITLDATVGGSSSNSYATREQAINFLSIFVNKDSFLLAAGDKQDIALINATYQLELKTFRGKKTATTQNLQFPRDCIYDKYGVQFDKTQIPDIIIQSQCLIAANLLSNNIFTDEDFANVKSFMHDTTQVEFWSSGVKGDVFPDEVYVMLRPILSSITTELVRM